MAFQLLQLGGTGLVSTPDSAALSITDDLDLRFRGIADDWATFQTFVSKRQGGNEWQFRTHFSGSQLLSLVWWDTGATARTVVADASLGFTGRAAHWVRVRKSGANVDFYKSDDDTDDHTAVTWTQVGTTQTTSTNAIESGSATHVTVGADGLGGGEPFYGFVHAAAVVDDVTTVASPVFADSTEWDVGETSGSTSDDAQANTWTLSGQAHIVGDNVQGAYVSLQLALGYNPFDATVIWTNATPDLRGVEFTRGRQYELDRIEAGTMTALLDNRHGNYNAHNTAGAYYPNIKPTVPIRLRAVYDGAVYPLWQGFVERWPVSFPGGTDSVVRVECADLFKLLSLGQAAGAARESVVDALSPVAHWRFDDTSDRTGNGHTLTFSGSPTVGGAAGAWQGDGATTFDGSNDYATVASETDVERQGSSRSWEFWFYPASTGGEGYILSIVEGLATNHQTLVGVQDSGTTLIVQGGDPIRATFTTITADAWHHLVVVDDLSSGFDRTLYLDGAAIPFPSTSEATGTLAVTIGAFSQTPTFEFGGRISEIVCYPSALTATQAASLYAATTETYLDELTSERIGYLLDNFTFPVSPAQNLEVGQSTMDGPNSPVGGSFLDAIGDAVDTENGVFFIAADGTATFHDRDYRATVQSASSGTFGPLNLTIFDLDLAVDDDRIYNEHRIAPDDTTDPFVVRNEDSIEAHGRRTFSRTIYPADANEALDTAHWLNAAHAEAQTRIGTMRLRLGGDTALWPVVLGAEISKRYTINKTTEGDDYSADHYLEAISMRITAMKEWDVEWQLSPASSLVAFILDDDVLGLLDGVGVLGY